MNKQYEAQRALTAASKKERKKTHKQIDKQWQQHQKQRFIKLVKLTLEIEHVI